MDVLSGAKSIAGRLPVTQCSNGYTSEVSTFNPVLRANATLPGRTYTWYTGDAVLQFGYGLHYTNFTFSWNQRHNQHIVYKLSWKIAFAKVVILRTQILQRCRSPSRILGDTQLQMLASHYVALLFLSSSDAGPSAIT